MARNDVWEKIFTSRPWGKYPSEALIRFAAKNFYNAPDRRKVKFLELGCGPGRNLWYLAREGFSAYGIDGSPGAIEQATQRLDNECQGWSGEIKIGDILSLPFPDASFDAVIDSEAVYLNSWEDARKIYQESCRVAKPGAKLLSITFSDQCLGNDKTLPARDLKPVAEGPIAEGQVARFTSRADIEELIAPWQLDQADLQSYSVNGADSGNFVSEWVITAHK